jgi:hypothetical protein
MFKKLIWSTIATLVLPLFLIPAGTLASADSLSIIPQGDEDKITDAIKAI